MATTPIIEIPVDTSEFDKFKKAFGEYQDKLREMPADWKALNQKITEFTKTQVAAGVTSEKAWGRATKAADSYGKTIHAIAHAQSIFTQGINATEASMARLYKTTRKVAPSIFGMARSATRFASFSLIGGLLGAGGLTFGLDRLADRVMTRQRTARGMGLSIGQFNSFRANMAPYAGVGALQAASEAQVNPAKFGLLAQMGISPQKAASENAAALTGQEVMAIHRAWRANPSMLSPVAMAAVQMGFTPEDIRNIGNARGSSLTAANAATASDASGLGVSNRVAHEYTLFAVQMHKAGILIETTLINTLAPLAEPLTVLSHRIADFIAGIGNSKMIGTWINDLGVDIQEFGKWLGSPAFHQDMADVAFGVHKMAAALHWAFGGPSKATAGGSPSNTPSVWKHSLSDALASRFPGNNPFNMFDAAGHKMGFQTQKEGITAAYARLGRYPAEYHTATLGQALAKWKGKWTGPGDMTTAAYIKLITSGASADPNGPIPFNDPAKMAAILHFQSIAEGHPVAQSVIAGDIASRDKTIGGHAAYLAKIHEEMAQQSANAAQKSSVSVSQTTDAGLRRVLNQISGWKTNNSNVKIQIDNNTAAQVHAAVNAASP